MHNEKRKTLLQSIGEIAAKDHANASASKTVRDAEKFGSRIWFNAFLVAVTEVLFVVVPFIVIGAVVIYQGHFRSLLLMPEWSIVGAVIGGQTIVKFLKAIHNLKQSDVDRVILAVTALIVLVVIPDLCILTIVLLSPSISIYLAITQGVLFSVSLFVFAFSCFLERGYVLEKQHGIE
jgi:hypothetical protein